jgi:hypothetical protein
MTSASAAPVESARVRRASADHRFFVGTAVFSLALAIVGFAPAIVDPSSRRAPLTPLVIVHGAAFTGWLILYLVQTLLASSGNMRIHRRLGVVGVVLAVVMMVGSYQTTIEMLRRGFDLSDDLVKFGPLILSATFQLPVMPIFGGLVAAALLYRRHPAVHKRLMWLTISGPLLGAPLAHAIGHFGLPFVVAPLAAALFALANPIYDRIAHGRIHPVSLWGGLGFFLFGGFQAQVLAPNPKWQAFVMWLAR